MCWTLQYCTINKGVCRYKCWTKTFNVQDYESVTGKNHQIIGLNVLIFWLHYITIYFRDIKFPNKESVTTQVLLLSKFKKQATKSSYTLQTKDKMSTRLEASVRFYHVLQLTNLVRLAGTTKKIICMTLSWLPGNMSTIFWTDIKLRPDLQHVCKNLYSKATILLFHIKYKLLQFIYKIVDVSHSK